MTADGRRILDGAGGAIVTNIGHGRRDVAEIAARSAGEVDYVIPPWATASRIALRDRLVRSWLPDGLTQVAFCGGGSEAAETAIRVARAYQLSIGQSERWKVIGRWPSYHGATIATLAMGGHQARRSGFAPLFSRLSPRPVG